MYPEYDDFYEPSEGEMFFDEMKEKFREILREDVNSKINRLTKENAELNNLDNCTFWAGDVLKVIDELGEVPE